MYDVGVVMFIVLKIYFGSVFSNTVLNQFSEIIAASFPTKYGVVYSSHITESNKYPHNTISKNKLR